MSPEWTINCWRRRPDLNRGWRFCRPLPYHLATAPVGTRLYGRVRPRLRGGYDSATRGGAYRSFAASGSAFALRASARQLPPAVDPEAEVGAGNGIRTRDFDLGKVALYH